MSEASAGVLARMLLVRLDCRPRLLHLRRLVFDERELRLMANCRTYAASDPAGLPGHQLMLLVDKLDELTARLASCLAPEQLDELIADYALSRDALAGRPHPDGPGALAETAPDHSERGR